MIGGREGDEVMSGADQCYKELSSRGRWNRVQGSGGGWRVHCFG